MKTSNRRIEDYIDIRTQASTQYMLHGQQQPYNNVCRAALTLNQVDDWMVINNNNNNNKWIYMQSEAR